MRKLKTNIINNFPVVRDVYQTVRFRECSENGLSVNADELDAYALIFEKSQFNDIRSQNKTVTEIL